MTDKKAEFGSLRERVKDGTYTAQQALELVEGSEYVSDNLVKWLRDFAKKPKSAEAKKQRAKRKNK